MRTEPILTALVAIVMLTLGASNDPTSVNELVTARKLQPNMEPEELASDFPSLHEISSTVPTAQRTQPESSSCLTIQLET
jgi:hypothetical protein